MEHIIGKLLQDFEQGKMTRRQLIQSLTLAATAASAVSAAPIAADDGQVIKAIALSHASYLVADYRRSRDWYANLFGMKVTVDTGTRADLAVGPSHLAFHNRPSPTSPVIDHIGLSIANWDEDKNVRGRTEAELKRRGVELQAIANSGNTLYIKDPDGFLVQLGGKD